MCDLPGGVLVAVAATFGVGKLTAWMEEEAMTDQMKKHMEDALDAAWWCGNNQTTCSYEHAAETRKRLEDAIDALDVCLVAALRSRDE